MLREIIFSMKIVLRNSIHSVTPRYLIPLEVKISNSGDELCIKDRIYSLNHNVYLAGFGKAVYGMAYEIEKLIGKHIKRGIISVPYNITNMYKQDMRLSENTVITVYEGAKNNLPDMASFNAAFEIYEMVKSLKEDDILLVLISGGGSALLSYPVEPVKLSEKSGTVKLLASAGADITEINTVRKRLSALKGGKLAELAFPAKVVSLIISDVIGDPLEYIASGPTVPNTDAVDAALNVIKKYELYDAIPPSIREVLSRTKETSVEHDFSHVFNVIIGSNARALATAKIEAEKLGYTSVILTSNIEGIVCDVAYFYTEFIKKFCKYVLKLLSRSEFRAALQEKLPILPKPYQNDVTNEVMKNIGKFENKSQFCFVAGGEPTVKIIGKGKGGRSQELALRVGLGLREELHEHKWLKEKFDIVFLSAGTDGIDGPTDAAGAVSYIDIADIATKENIDPVQYVKNNDSYNFFSKFNNGNDIIKIGHSGTNVMDIHLIAIRLKDI